MPWYTVCAMDSSRKSSFTAGKMYPVSSEMKVPSVCEQLSFEPRSTRCTTRRSCTL